MALHSLHAPPPHTCLRVRRMPPCVSVSEHSVRRERVPGVREELGWVSGFVGTHFTRRCGTHCYGSALHATTRPRRNAHDATVYSLRPSMHACALRNRGEGEARASGAHVEEPRSTLLRDSTPWHRTPTIRVHMMRPCHLRERGLVLMALCPPALSVAAAHACGPFDLGLCPSNPLHNQAGTTSSFFVDRRLLLE